MKRVVIIGGGFGGLTVAQALSRTSLEIVLVDR
ncbi:MAG: NAD(P)-binding protein, partial [Nitrospiraceae bacterium]